MQLHESKLRCCSIIRYVANANPANIVPTHAASMVNAPEPQDSIPLDPQINPGFSISRLRRTIAPQPLQPSLQEFSTPRRRIQQMDRARRAEKSPALLRENLQRGRLLEPLGNTVQNGGPPKTQSTQQNLLHMFKGKFSLGFRSIARGTRGIEHLSKGVTERSIRTGDEYLIGPRTIPMGFRGTRDG